MGAKVVLIHRGRGRLLHFFVRAGRTCFVASGQLFSACVYAPVKAGMIIGGIMSFHHLGRALLAGVVSVSMLAQQAVAQTAEPVAGGSTAPVATTLTDQNWQQELAVWQAASSGNTPDEYRAYLRSYPTGKFADIARSRVAAAETVEAPAPTVAATPAAPPPAFMPGTPMTEEGLLDRTMRREVQGRLTSTWFSNRRC